MSTTKVYPLSAIRTLALHAQCLTTPSGDEARPTSNTIYEIIEQLCCVQIDTLQMVRRSHYVIVWSRLGNYDVTELDRLVYGAERRCFEYWMHAACIIPYTEYRYRLPLMHAVKQGASERSRLWLEKPGNAELVKAVRKRIQDEGALRAADFEHDGTQRGSWWNWKPAKGALEYLFNCGELMIADRVNFQRVYDLRERVLPEWVNQHKPKRDETARHMLELSLRALGACTPSQVSTYTHDLSVTSAKSFITALKREGVFVEVKTELSDGKKHVLLVHRDNMPLLEQAADGSIQARRTTFLNPFDPLFYPRGRDQQLWNFRQVLEAYKPEGTRIWGYFCLPILRNDQLIGRFDPKLERQTGILRLKSLHLEPTVKPSDELIADLAAAMREFMAFHDATDLVIERSQPVALKRRLLAAM